MLKLLNANEVEKSYQPYDQTVIETLWNEVRPAFHHKIVVLDDDPTGVQTVHNVSVYTDWSEETIEQGFLEDCQIFFILTNSRAFTESETEAVHQDIAERVERISKKYNQPFVIISRSDSTLRGHYPLENEVMRETIEKQGNLTIDGEIIVPFFKQGGRLTIDNIHFVQDGDQLVPAGETEFAKDRTFGYQSSHLGEWIEEKTEGAFKKSEVTYISLESLRKVDIDGIVEKLLNVTQFGKVVVNALDDEDVQVFTIALMKAMNKGKNFLFRTAATFTRVMGDISNRPLLTRDELIKADSTNGGLIVVGSHVKKTTEQLKQLQTLTSLHFIEFDCHLVLNEKAFSKEIERVLREAGLMVSKGITTVIYTKRQRLDLGENMEEEELKLSVKISDALTVIVRKFPIRPNYIIAKGGITSSDVGTKGLGVKRATVVGQIGPGIPVWKIGKESTFPDIPYIIFPGNVGSASTLRDIVLTLN